MTEEPDYIEIDVVPDLNRNHNEPARGLFQIMPEGWKIPGHTGHDALVGGIRTPPDHSTPNIWALPDHSTPNIWALPRTYGRLRNYWAQQRIDWQTMLLKFKLQQHFWNREQQHLEQSTALWITRPPEPVTYISRINHTWKA